MEGWEEGMTKTKENHALRELAARIDAKAKEMATLKFEQSVRRLKEFMEQTRMSSATVAALLPHTEAIGQVPQGYVDHARTMLIERMLNQNEREA